MINLGDKVKDLVTGFEGIVIAETIWLNGCKRMLVQPQGLDKDGKPFADATFDDKQLKVVKAGVVKAVDAIVPVLKRTGGPRNDKAAARR